MSLIIFLQRKMEESAFFSAISQVTRSQNLISSSLYWYKSNTKNPTLLIDLVFELSCLTTCLLACLLAYTTESDFLRILDNGTTNFEAVFCKRFVIQITNFETKHVYGNSWWFTHKSKKWDFFIKPNAIYSQLGVVNMIDLDL